MVRQMKMAAESTNTEGHSAFTAQAIIDLTEANVSAAGHGTDWEREVAFLHDSTEESAGPSQAEFGEAIDLSIALA